jgi:tRNA(Ile)-lysidine synthase
VPCIDWPGARVYRYRGRLFAVAGQAAASFHEGAWTIGTAFDLGSLGRLDLRPSTGLGLSRERLPSVLRVARRPHGARFRPAGGAHHRPLRKWLQEHGVLPWQREALPLLEVAGEIVAIGDLAYGGTLAAAPGEPSWVVDWTGRPVLTEAEAVGASSGTR